jgi:hypothetical protein
MSIVDDCIMAAADFSRMGRGGIFSSRIFVTNGCATSPTSLQAQMDKRTKQILSEEKQKGYQQGNQVSWEIRGLLLPKKFLGIFNCNLTFHCCGKWIKERNAFGLE